ncbi:DsbE family thiol:disulfide interchange protein [Oceanibacterium hippocampi]|uniref:Thiol:disulfide interchange protein CycY n=1 Tax=Oceanibacterium hippocampi TaxID=745714 RepID=A0A1Y5RD59_9PROT|nr:DsbE family thiol:disulfide interchange protein [Oceanibacterium hippocampi]SLN14667.1 Thiol:disulfide interchange protein CycY precursor [Oceanibacterium hippocampi]
MTSTPDEPTVPGSEAAIDAAPAPARRGGARYFLPVAIFVVLTVVMGYGLFYLDPKEIPSALIDKPMPEFDLPPVPGHPLGLASADLKGEITLVNVFASWCVACRAEHDLLMQIARSGTVTLHGLDYKDPPQAARNWLDRMGNPYTRIGMDQSGRTGIDLGVYGVPETFVVSPDGQILDKVIGPLTPRSLEQQIMPWVRKYQK